MSDPRLMIVVWQLLSVAFAVLAVIALFKGEGFSTVGMLAILQIATGIQANILKLREDANTGRIRFDK